MPEPDAAERACCVRGERACALGGWEIHMDLYRKRRLDSALCALALLLSACLTPAAAAADAAGQEQPQTLTAAQVRQMEQTDAAVTALTTGGEYGQLSPDQQQQAAQQQLEQLERQGLVQPGSVYTDAENGMVSFTYSCGVLGGILLADPEEENSPQLNLPPDEEEFTTVEQMGSAAIYYAFDNTVNSSRYPYYAYMQSYWTSVGLDTDLDTGVTVSDLKHMGDYDVCMLSAHGAYYTYQYGWLWKRQATAPIILLTQEADFWSDLRYGGDLLNHRIIKVNGMYAVTGDFFRNAYRGGGLQDTIVLSETCEFYGRSGRMDRSMVDALLSGGASVVVGYVNNVYSVYSRSMMWQMVNRLLHGDTISQAVQYGLDRYGKNDIIWYNAQGGRKPHAVASYPIISGNHSARLVPPVTECPETVPDVTAEAA